MENKNLKVKPIVRKNVGGKKNVTSKLLLAIGVVIMSVGLFIIIGGLVALAADDSETSVPESVSYHTAEDLTRATGVEFPEVVPVDSIYYDSFMFNYYTGVRFVPAAPLSKEFFSRLDQACIDDSLCWKKDEDGYHYTIYPKRPLDRTQGDCIRMVELNGELVPDWDGDYVSVFVPFAGDTICIEDGWVR